MAGAEARRKRQRRAKSTPRAVVVAGVTAAVAVATAAFAVQRHAVDERGVVKDDGKVVEYGVTEEEGREQQGYWTEERVREAVRDSKPLGPLGIERD